MDFPKRLRLLLSNGDSSADEKFSLSVQKWNDTVEASFSDPRLAPEVSDGAMDALEDASTFLHSCILSAVVSCCSHSTAESDTSILDFVKTAIDSDDAAADSAAKRAAAIPRRHFTSLQNEGQIKLVSELLRASKNILRFHSQVLAPLFGSRQQVSLTRRLSSNGMLELYVSILETKQPDAARYASLSLFYSAYNPMDDETTRNAQSYLIDKLDFLRVLMNVLLQSRPTDLVLSLVRHVHNLVASVQGTAKQINVILMELSANPTEKHDAPWIQSNWDGSNLTSLLVSITAWCLRSDPLFPGDGADRRADVVLECLRVLFVLHAGASIMDQSSSEENNSLKRLVCDLLGLNDNESRSFACKLETISLLIDSPTGFSDYLVACSYIDPLLCILELQASNVVDHCIPGNQAATALTPILVVLNNFSAANISVLQKVKQFIFPPDAEEAFQKKAVAEKTGADKKGIGAKNMSPLDAPKASLRWKLIRLMTWTESHTKRLTCELLWTLCGGDAREFVLRTGFGNAMPHLAYKGLVQLPTEITR